MYKFFMQMRNISWFKMLKFRLIVVLIRIIPAFQTYKTRLQ